MISMMEEDIDHVITRLEATLKATTKQDRKRVAHIALLGEALNNRFISRGSTDDLEAAVVWLDEGVKLAQGDDPNRAACLNNFGNALRMRFERKGVEKDIHDSVAALEEAIESTLDGYSQPIYSNNLGCALQTRFERTGQITDLNRAILVLEEAVNSNLEDPSNRAMFSNNHGCALSSRYDLFGAIEDLNSSVVAKRQAVNLIGGDHPHRSSYLNNLGHTLTNRFKRVESREDIDEAISVLEEAAQSTPPHRRHVCLKNLGNALQSRFTHCGSMIDLDNAVVAQQKAIDGIPPGHPLLSASLNDLGGSLVRRFERTGSETDLDCAITSMVRAIELLHDSDTRRAFYMSNLSHALQCRFECNGLIKDLTDAIEANQEAVHLLPKDHPRQKGCLNNLANALRRRFGLTGSLQDLEEALEFGERVMQMTPPTHKSLPGYLSNFAGLLLDRFKRKKSLEDLYRAISAFEHAISITTSQEMKATHMNNRGIAQHLLFQETKSLESLNSGIASKTAALQLSPPGHRDRPSYLHSVGNALRLKFQVTKSITNLDEAIIMLDEAIKITPTHHPILATYFQSLGHALQTRFNEKQSHDDRVLAIQMFESGALHSTAPHRDRILAAGYAALLIRISEDVQRISRLLRLAVELLPLANPRTLDRIDQQHILSNFGNLTSVAASMCLESGLNPFETVQLLEIGRGVMASSKLDIRSDITLLETMHPKEAEQFRKLRDKLDSTLSHTEVDDTVDTGADFIGTEIRTRSYVVSNEFDSMVKAIRMLEGFERFLLGPSQNDLLTMAEQGPIIVLNIAERRSDALLITKSGVKLLPLPGLKYSTLQEKVKSLKTELDSSFISNYVGLKRKMKSLLKWLWNVAAGPVMAELGFIECPKIGDMWPRVWWVTSGLANVVPIHSAGHHKEGSTDTVIDRVVSSYTPSIKALKYARETASSIRIAEKQRAVIVAMTSAIDETHLPYVDSEMRDLETLLRPRLELVTLRNPNKRAVLTELAACQIVHFACHGHSSLSNPSESRLILKDWVSDPLTVADLTAMKLDRCQLAYLSACHAANNPDINLLEEGIHLAGACQLAGFPYVIGTLWVIDDKESAALAPSVYHNMLDESGHIDVMRSAHGLHHAILQLRDHTRHPIGLSSAIPDDPLIWATYIHMGA